MRGGALTPLPERRSTVDDFVVVLNAGSSSLKFCAYSRPQGDAAGGSPAADRLRASARRRASPRGTAPASRSSTKRSAKRSRDARGRARCAGRVVAQAVSGTRGLSASVIASSMAARTFPIRSSSRPMSSTRLRALVPLAPLHQPHNLAAIDAVTARLPHVPQVACFDTSFHRGHAPVADLVPLPKEIRDARRSALRLSRLVVRVHRLGAAAGRAERSRAAA